MVFQFVSGVPATADVLASSQYKFWLHSSSFLINALCLSSMKASSWWHKEDFLLHVSVCEQFEKRSGIRRSVIDTNLWPSVT